MILDHTLPKRSTLKARKTFTLSPESVEFLEALRKARKAYSISSVLDDILRAVRREQTKAKVNQAVG
ncbi:MAG TPA: hypothetical protein VM120_11350, partial [Bryobacteraceae bacterium]|nr:hypothetical protein [Bryobacteraceae bacterium]